jgi:hypothetical protein
LWLVALGGGLGSVTVELVDAITIHVRVEHFQGAAASVDLVVMGEIGEAFENAEQLLVPWTPPDLYIAGAALRAEGPESRQLVAALSRNANESAAQCGSSSDSPLEEDGFELVVPDFRATFFLCFRAQNWPGATPLLMTDNGSFSVSRARLARVPNPPEGGNARRWQSGASTPLLDC